MTGHVHLVTGSDPTLVSDEVIRLVDEAVGDADRGLVLDSLSGEDYEIGSVVDAARTPPFLTDLRVVAARNVERFKADDLAALVGYLADPLDTTVLVLEYVGGRVPKALADGVKKAGGITHRIGAPQKARERSSWVDDQISAAGLQVDAAGRRALEERLGEDLGRISGVLDLLASAFGPDHPIGASEIEQFAGEAGGVKPWDLTDALDRGDVAGAVRMVHRMLDAGGLHPLQIMSTLHRHYRQMLRLDGADVTSKAEAAELLGVSPYPAQKALTQSRRLGHAGLVRAYRLLADADLAIRGTVGYPREIADAMVMEMLVTRLARLV